MSAIKQDCGAPGCYTTCPTVCKYDEDLRDMEERLSKIRSIVGTGDTLIDTEGVAALQELSRKGDRQ